MQPRATLQGPTWESIPQANFMYRTVVAGQGQSSRGHVRGLSTREVKRASLGLPQNRCKEVARGGGVREQSGPQLARD